MRCFFNEKALVSCDNWFKVETGNGIFFSGHFTLKR